MRPSIIHKTPNDLRLSPNLADYEAERKRFSWDQILKELAGFPGGGLNLAYEAVDRHALGPRRDHVAFRWVSRKGDERLFTYANLMRLTNRFANVLKNLEIGKGDRLFIL